MVRLSAIHLSTSLLRLLMMVEDLDTLILEIYLVLGRMDMHHTFSIEDMSHTAMRVMQILAGRKLEPLDRSSWMERCKVARRCLSYMQTR